MLEKTLESPLDCKEFKPVNPKGNQSWIFIGRTKAETPILWPPDAKNQLVGKDPDAGKDWRREEKGTAEDEMALWMQWTWIWVSSGSWWWTGNPGVLQSIGSQRVGHDWVTELNWVIKLCGVLCNPMDCSMPGFPDLHHLLDLAQIHVHWVSDTIQPSHPLLPLSPSALNLSQHQDIS